jgi:hypothetical protein
LPKGAYDVFTLVVNFLEEDWMPKHIIINSFETLGQTLARSLQTF